MLLKIEFEDYLLCLQCSVDNVLMQRFTAKTFIEKSLACNNLSIKTLMAEVSWWFLRQVGLNITQNFLSAFFGKVWRIMFLMPGTEPESTFLGKSGADGTCLAETMRYFCRKSFPKIEKNQN